MREAFEFLALGGPLMAIIGAGSIVATTVFFERLWALQRRRVVPRHFLGVVQDRLRDGQPGEARALCGNGETALAAVLLAGLRRAGRDRALIREAMEDRGRREAAELERFTGVLGAVATVSPLLGLLGTITGMIKTFQQVNTSAGQGEVSAGLMANGIWEALISTAAGLSVAIPAYLAYRVVIARVDMLVSELETAAVDTLDLIDNIPEETA